MQDPRIHLSESDFMDITAKGGLRNAVGGIGRVEFESIMRREMHAYLQVSNLFPSFVLWHYFCQILFGVYFLA